MFEQTEMREVLARHLGECGRFGLPCTDVHPRDRWCARCDLVACVEADLTTWIGARLAEVREDVAEVIADTSDTNQDFTPWGDLADAALAVVAAALGAQEAVEGISRALDAEEGDR